ncbi:MAG: hypothetical protein AAFY88_17200, partial [Acidobacteriota bacterium]
MSQAAAAIELTPQDLEASCALLGVFPLPAGLLALPPVEGPDPEVLDRLADGDTRAPMPPAWRFLRAALEGDAGRALELAASLPEPWASYNSLVLGADPELGRRLTADGALLPAPFAELAAAAAYIHGLRDQPPEVPADSPPEALAAVRMVRAASALEGGRDDDARTELGQAFDAVRTRSPVFAAQLAAQRAELLRDQPQRAVIELQSALKLAGELGALGQLQGTLQ